jgi:hypothetical protein
MEAHGEQFDRACERTMVVDRQKDVASSKEKRPTEKMKS